MHDSHGGAEPWVLMITSLSAQEPATGGLLQAQAGLAGHLPGDLPGEAATELLMQRRLLSAAGHQGLRKCCPSP